jgi:predicted O-linked N-acetylglucosamine transferase (SPINDLY family)
MDMELFRHIAQTLKAQFPNVPERELLQHAIDLYQQESRRLQSLGESKRFEERLRRTLDLSRNTRPQINSARNTKLQNRFKGTSNNRFP